MEQLKTLVAPRSSVSESKGDQKAVTGLGADCSSKRGCFKLNHQLTNYVNICQITRGPMQAMHVRCSCDLVTLVNLVANSVCYTLAGIQCKDGDRHAQPAVFYLCKAESSIICCTKSG